MRGPERRERATKKLRERRCTMPSPITWFGKCRAEGTLGTAISGKTFSIKWQLAPSLLPPRWLCHNPTSFPSPHLSSNLIRLSPLPTSLAPMPKAPHAQTAMSTSRSLFSTGTSKTSAVPTWTSRALLGGRSISRYARPMTLWRR